MHENRHIDQCKRIEHPEIKSSNSDHFLFNSEYTIEEKNSLQYQQEKLNEIGPNLWQINKSTEKSIKLTWDLTLKIVKRKHHEKPCDTGLEGEFMNIIPQITGNINWNTQDYITQKNFYREKETVNRFRRRSTE